MNLCFLSVCQFNEFSGGVDRVCCLLSREFIKRGYKVIYLYSEPSKLGRPAEGCEGDGQYQFPYEDIWDKRNEGYCVETLKKHNVDIVIDVAFVSRYHDIAYQAKNEHNFKLISTCHCDPFCDLKKLRDNFDEIAFRQSNLIKRLSQQLLFFVKLPLSYYLRKKSLKGRFQTKYEESDAYVFLCDGYAKKIQKLLNVPDGKVVSICNPINLSHKDTVVKRNQVAFVGRMAFQKRVDRLLRIWKKVEKKNNDWNLVLVGDGDCLDTYKDYAKRLGLQRVEFLGATPSTLILAQSKIVAVTSTHEGFGMTLVEGMSVGAIPIAFDSYEAVRDIINNGENGFVIKPYSTSQYASKILQLTESQQLVERMSRVSAVAVNKFSLSAIVDKWVLLFSKL